MMDASFYSKINRRICGCTALVSVAMAMGAAPAYAQAAADAAASEGDIIVTAQRRAESIQSVPISITAVTAEQLKSQNVQGVEDFFAMTPNVSFQSNGSRDRKDLSIRGISNQLNPYADVRQSSYAFYIDDFNVVAGTSNPQIVDLERIEVLRGPQGTYFGRNAVGGAINVTTKKPVDRWEGEVEVGYSSFDTKRAQAVINVPISPGLFAIRAAGQYEKSDGYIKNINPIGGGNDSKYYTGRIQGRFTPSENFTWDLMYSYSNEATGMRNGVPTGFVTRTWASVYYRTTAGVIGNPDGVGFYPNNINRVNFNRPQKVGTKFDYISSRAVWDMGPVSLTSVLGHLKSSLFNYGDVDGGSPDFFYEDLKVTRKSTSGELRLASNGKQALEWSVGTVVGKDTGLSDQSTFHGAQSPLCPASTGGRCNGLEVTGADGYSTSKYFALFAQGTWNISDQWAATAGVRYSKEKVTNDSQTRSNTILTGINDRSASFDDVSPKFTISYKPQTDWMIFATASRGFKAGGTQTANTAQLRNEFDPETLWNYELGTKFDLFDKRVRVDITGFYMDWKKIQQTIRFQFIDPVTGLLRGVSGIDNAAAAESYGIEASFDAKLTDFWMLSGQVGYNKSKYKDWKNALIDGNVIDVSGQELTNAPEWTLGAQTQYTVPITDELESFARVEWNYRAKMVSNPFYYLYKNVAGEPFLSPSYHNVNVRLGVETEKFRAVVFVENLFKEKFYANAYEKAFYSGVQVEPSFRQFGVNVGYKF
ncbi:TonB-dependent receptor [Rhizorhabdus sp. FW153]|uniref:TonB-dependent receptor n=1 Tax=Rhizorhabdus sp. FW153 TaxID=3400216 RepID=UPI003CEE4584